MLDASLSPEHPLLILSGNEIEHALLGYAAMLAAIPHAPVSPAYSLVSKDFARLQHIVDLLEPGMVYASDGERFAPAIAAVASLGAWMCTVLGHWRVSWKLDQIGTSENAAQARSQARQ